MTKERNDLTAEHNDADLTMERNDADLTIDHSDDDFTRERNDADFTRERSEIWRLGWPILIGMGSHIFFHLVDMYWVGYLGTNALSGVAVAGSLMMLLWTASRIAHIGGVAVMAQAFGRKDTNSLRSGAVDSIVVGTGTGLVIFLIVYPLLESIVTFYGLGPEAYAAAIAYLSVSLLGVVPLLPLFRFARSANISSVLNMIPLGQPSIVIPTDSP